MARCERIEMNAAENDFLFFFFFFLTALAFGLVVHKYNNRSVRCHETDPVVHSFGYLIGLRDLAYVASTAPALALVGSTFKAANQRKKTITA